MHGGGSAGGGGGGGSVGGQGEGGGDRGGSHTRTSSVRESYRPGLTRGQSRTEAHADGEEATLKRESQPVERMSHRVRALERRPKLMHSRIR